jgi:hypothetical protein
MGEVYSFMSDLFLEREDIVDHLYYFLASAYDGSKRKQLFFIWR